MNRLNLTTLLKDIINLYIEDKFTYIYIISTMNLIGNEENDENKNAYLQTELIATMFSQFPYYRLLSDLTDLGNYIIEVTQGNSNYKNIAKLLKNGCLAEMIPDIKRRVQTETMAHITTLLYIYKKSELKPDTVLNHLTKNMYDPNILTSMDYAESINYKQESIPGIEMKILSLREIISRANTNRKEAVRRNLEEYTIKNFDEKSLEDFIQQVINIIGQSSLSDKELLKDTISEILTALFAKSVIVWSPQV